jgi:hypothetical protein
LQKNGSYQQFQILLGRSKELNPHEPKWGGSPPTQGWPIPFSNSLSAARSPGRISTPFSKSNIAEAHPIKDKISATDIKILFIATKSPF